MRLSVSSRVLASISIAGLLLAVDSPLSAQEAASLGALQNHDHPAIIVASRPVIERLPVKVIAPTDLRVSDSGYVFVADKVARCVFRIDSDGIVSLPISNARDLHRIQVDADDNLYVLTMDGRESSIQMVNPIGKSVVLHNLSIPVTSFVRNSIGHFIVASAGTNRLMLISPEGEVTELGRMSEPIIDLVLNAGGQTEALLESGEIVHIAVSGDVTSSGFAPARSSRLMLQPDGSLLALTGQLGGIAQLVAVSRDVVRPTDFVPFANVPEGTQAVGFDSLGNLCLANPDLRAVTKVTSHFRIPCPHCGRATEMIFRQDAPPATKSDTRSF